MMVPVDEDEEDDEYDDFDMSTGSAGVTSLSNQSAPTGDDIQSGKYYSLKVIRFKTNFQVFLNYFLLVYAFVYDFENSH